VDFWDLNQAQSSEANLRELTSFTVKIISLAPGLLLFLLPSINPTGWTVVINFNKMVNNLQSLILQEHPQTFSLNNFPMMN